MGRKVVFDANINKFFIKSNSQILHDMEYSGSEGTRAIKYGREDEAAAFEEIILVAKDQLSNFSKSEHKLKFLKITIFILYETQRRFVDKPDILQELIHLYWTTYQGSLQKSSVPDYLSIDVCERYLDLLENDANHDWFERNVAGDNHETSREKETARVADVLKGLLARSRDNDKKGNNALSGDEKDEKKRMEQLLARAKAMLMAWYNLGKAVEIATFLQGKRLETVRRFVSGWLPEALAGLFAGYVILRSWGVLDISRYWLPWNSDLSILILYIVMAAIAIFFLIPLWRKGKKIDLQIFLPRMAAGIIVGYLALLSDEAWGGIFVTHMGWDLTGRLGAPCLAVLLYVSIEMNNVRGITYPIVWKTLRLFFRGACYAVLAAVLISDLFGRSIVERLRETAAISGDYHEILPLNGLFGYVYPEVILYLSPLALFIGVFVQLLWEDKTLTAKI